MHNYFNQIYIVPIWRILTVGEIDRDDRIQFKTTSQNYRELFKRPRAKRIIFITGKGDCLKRISLWYNMIYTVESELLMDPKTCFRSFSLCCYKYTFPKKNTPHQQGITTN